MSEEGYFEDDAPPPTVKDVLLERFKMDTREMASELIQGFWSNIYDCYIFEDGFSTSYEDKAIDHYAVILNSPAEVEA